MAISISYGCFASIRPADTSLNTLITADNDKEYNGVLRVCNQDSSLRTYTIAHLTATGLPAGKDYIAYEKEINFNATEEWSLHIGAGEEIQVKTDAADKVSFHFSGECKVTS
jgi:hypothetical protein